MNSRLRSVHKQQGWGRDIPSVGIAKTILAVFLQLSFFQESIRMARLCTDGSGTGKYVRDALVCWLPWTNEGDSRRNRSS